MTFAPGGDCIPLNTSRTRLPSTTTEVAPSTLPAAVSMRWPHCRTLSAAAGVAGGEDGSAARARGAAPPSSTPPSSAPPSSAPPTEAHRRAVPRRMRAWALRGQSIDSASFPPDFSFASDSMACSRTSAPAARSAADALSASLWLNPPAQGTKIMAVGTTAARLQESWPAPLTISIAS